MRPMGRSLRPAAPGPGPRGPWSHPPRPPPCICGREAGHVAGRLRCRIMTRMSEPVLPPPSSRVGVSAETLIVRTQRIEEPVQLVDHIPAGVSAAWLRHGQGVVALGTAWAVHTDRKSTRLNSSHVAISY